MKQIVLLALVGVVIAGAHRQLPTTPRRAEGEAPVPDANLVRVASLGFDALASDLYWMQAVQIGGDARGTAGRSHRIGALVDLLTQLDPWVDHPYRFAALWMTDDVPAVRTANRLLERGIEHHPDEWRNRFYLAFNYFYWLGDSEKAAEALEPALGLPGAPRYLPRMVARLKSQGEGLDVSAAFLNEMLRRTEDPVAKAEYQRALLEIEAESRARLLDRAREEFKRRQGRDLVAVEELLHVEPPVLARLPEEPNGSSWVLNDEGVIVSEKLRFRYVPKLDGTSRMLIEQLHEKTDEEGETP
ncbi:MAG: hypothetical protein GY937_19110 [bacterium]|nr:hypothetical protein [bacterium]